MIKNVNAFKLTVMVNHRCIVKKCDFSSARISCMKDYYQTYLTRIRPRTRNFGGTNNLNSPLQMV